MGERPGEGGDIGRSSIVIGNALISPLASPLPRSLGERPGERASPRTQPDFGRRAVNRRSPQPPPGVFGGGGRGLRARRGRRRASVGFVSSRRELSVPARRGRSRAQLDTVEAPPICRYSVPRSHSSPVSFTPARVGAARHRSLAAGPGAGVSCSTRTFATHSRRRSYGVRNMAARVLAKGPAARLSSLARPVFRRSRTARGCLPRAAGRIPATGRDGGMSCRGTGPASTTLLSLAADLRLGG
jgi:hypothetical protein